MFEFIIILLARWTYPILGFILVRYTEPKGTFRKWIVSVTIGFSILAIVGYLSKVSTTSTELDWVLFTIPYFLISVILWSAFYFYNKVVKYIGLVMMILTFGLGYLAGSIGILGVGFVIGYSLTDSEKWFENGVIYKESALGNAVSDSRGKRVTISKTTPWLPIIEWQLESREYSGRAVYKNILDVEYDSKKKEFYLSTTDQFSEPPELWSDTLKILK